RRPATVRARRAGDHRPQPLLPRGGKPAAGAAWPRLRLAGHRHARIAGRGLELCRDHREAPGPARVLSRGDRLEQPLDRRRAAARAGPTAGEERLWPLPPRPAGARDHRRMKVIETGLPGCLVLEPKVFGDARGFFYESFNRDKLAAAGLSMEFVQGNVSRSSEG